MDQHQAQYSAAADQYGAAADQYAAAGGQYAAATEAEEKSRRKMSPRAALRLRRLIGLTLALGMAYAIFHLVFRTELLAPVLAHVGPIQGGVEWVLADPKRAWMALAAIVVPHIGLYYMLFEDRK